MCFQAGGVGGLCWRGWGEDEEVKNIYGSGMLTTKYPGALSVTNSNKSFSKRTVVNSKGRGFFFLFFFLSFFATAYFRLMKGTFSLWSTNVSLDREKERTKEAKKKILFTPASPNCLFQ